MSNSQFYINETEAPAKWNGSPTVGFSVLFGLVVFDDVTCENAILRRRFVPLTDD